VCRLKKKIKKEGKGNFLSGWKRQALYVFFVGCCAVAKMRNVLACVLDLLSE